MAPRTFLFLSAILVQTLVACGGKSADDLRKEAEAALQAGDPAKAEQIVDEALKGVGSDKAAAWRLEQVKLEAMTKAKKGSAVPAELERLAGAYPQQVTPALYRSLADKAKAGGDTPGAIDILAAGDKRYPEEATFKQAIEEIKSAGVSAEEVEQLKALGYL